MSNEQLRAKIVQVFGSLPMPGSNELFQDCSSEPEYVQVDYAKSYWTFAGLLVGRTWQDLPVEFLKAYWAHYCYFSPVGFRYYLPALMYQALEDFTVDGPLTSEILYVLEPSAYAIYYHSDDEEFRSRQAVLSPTEYLVICEVLELAFDTLKRGWQYRVAKAIRWGWNNPNTPAFAKTTAYYRDLHAPTVCTIIDQEVQEIIDQIHAAFADTPYPGDHALSGTEQGEEGAECGLEFRGLRWQQLSPGFLVLNDEALSFLSDKGFRYFIPAFLVADLLRGLWSDSVVFHLTHGFDSTVEEEMQQYCLERMSHFTREERLVIIRYLKYRQSTCYNAERILTALDNYWSPSISQADSE